MESQLLYNRVLIREVYTEYVFHFIVTKSNLIAVRTDEEVDIHHHIKRFQVCINHSNTI